ncbi:putative reverse transcriptase zinc-binding domain-containing protein [Helianthus anomalus]
MFVWQATEGRIPTKDALARRGIPIINDLCPDCGWEQESANHTLVSCMHAKAVWWQVCIWLQIPVSGRLLSSGDY